MEVSASPRGLTLMPRSRRLLGALGDARLVQEIRRGNDVAFEVVFDRHHRAILTFARHMLASGDEAEDVVQHTFAQAYYSLHRTDREIQLRPWLYAIARNRCLSLLRARREQPGELDDIPTTGLSDAVQQRADLRELLRDVRDLPEDQRAALVLSQLGDLPHAQIAEVLGCEPMKVKSLVFQARSALIDSRVARETPCQEIREQLATLHGGALRRSTLNRHVRACPGCAEFREHVRRQRNMLAAALPVVPSVALKSSVLGALGLGSGSTATAGAAAGGSAATGSGAAGVAGGGAAGSGGIASALGSMSAVKVAAIVVAAGAAIGGGVALTHHRGHPSRHSALVRLHAPGASGQREARVTSARASSSPTQQTGSGVAGSAHPAAFGHRHPHGHKLASGKTRLAKQHASGPKGSSGGSSHSQAGSGGHSHHTHTRSATRHHG